jgi:hypothetical protein
MYYRRYNSHIVTQTPKYVVVDCRHFGDGFHGWRLSEVAFFAYAKDYPSAKDIIEDAKMFRDGNGLYFMVKYENWLDKGGEEWNEHCEYNKWYFL